MRVRCDINHLEITFLDCVGSSMKNRLVLFISGLHLPSSSLLRLKSDVLKYTLCDACFVLIKDFYLIYYYYLFNLIKDFYFFYYS